MPSGWSPVSLANEPGVSCGTNVSVDPKRRGRPRRRPLEVRSRRDRPALLGPPRRGECFVAPQLFSARLVPSQGDARSRGALSKANSSPRLTLPCCSSGSRMVNERRTGFAVVHGSRPRGCSSCAHLCVPRRGLRASCAIVSKRNSHIARAMWSTSRNNGEAVTSSKRAQLLLPCRTQSVGLRLRYRPSPPIRNGAAQTTAPTSLDGATAQERQLRLACRAEEMLRGSPALLGSACAVAR